MIRKSTENDLVRLAEISVFTKRVAYRPIFNDDEFSFNVLTVTGVMDVLRMHLDAIWVWEDSNIVKGFVHVNKSIKIVINYSTFFILPALC
jgi:putative acetyltransferase